MTIEFNITEDDFVDFQRQFARLRPWYTKLVPRFAEVMIVILLLLLLLAFTEGTNVGLQTLNTLGPLVLLLAVIVAYFRFFSRYQSRLLCRKSQNLLGAMILDASNESFSVVSTRGRTQDDWTSFRKFSETDRLFMLFMDPPLCTVIPKRAFTPDQLEEFRTLLREKIGPAK